MDVGSVGNGTVELRPQPQLLPAGRSRPCCFRAWTLQLVYGSPLHADDGLHLPALHQARGANEPSDPGDTGFIREESVALLAHVRFLDRIGLFSSFKQLNRLQMAMLAYLSAWEDKTAAQLRDEEFKNLVFASDLQNDLRFWKKMHPEQNRAKRGVEEVVPQNADEVESLLEELRTFGFGGAPEPVHEIRV